MTLSGAQRQAAYAEKRRAREDRMLLALIKIRQRAMTTEQGPFRDEVIILAEEGLKR